MYLSIKGYEVDYDDYTIKISCLSPYKGVPNRNTLQVVYRPYRKDTVEKMKSFIEMVRLFFDNNKSRILKSKNKIQMVSNRRKWNYP